MIPNRRTTSQVTIRVKMKIKTKGMAERKIKEVVGREIGHDHH